MGQVERRVRDRAMLTTVLDPGRRATTYDIGLRPGTRIASYISAPSPVEPSLVVQANGRLNGDEQLIPDFSPSSRCCSRSSQDWVC